MAGSMRAESSLNNLGGSTFAGSYSSGQRGAYSGTNLERSSSFRESIESRAQDSKLGTSRNAAQPEEISPASQYLTLEPIALIEQKYTRSNELRRVLGVSLEEHHSFGFIQSKSLPPIASEDLKRFKASLQDTSSWARERAKLLNESILKVDKYQNFHSKKRQRNEVSSIEKFGSSTLLKTGGQIHQNPTSITQRSEERTRMRVPNRRVRSSIAESEGRGTVPLRPGTIMDKDKNMPFDNNKGIPRTSNGSLILSEDKVRGLPTRENAWEIKMKRKRSLGTMVRTPDGDPDLKLAIQRRPNNELRPRSSDGLGFRPGSVTGCNKMDPSSQLTGANSRIIPRNEVDNVSFQNDRKERVPGVDKEHIITKGSNKINIREDAQVGNQIPSTKVKGSRAPRSGASALMNTPNFPRPPGGVDGCEEPPGLNKFQPSPGTVNRKRPLLTEPSSSPITQWGVRPNKNSRTKRANKFNPVSNFEEAQNLPDGYAASDVGAGVTTAKSSALLPSRGISNNSNQLKSKPDNVPDPALISESEEASDTENKSKDKVVFNADVEDGTLNAVNKDSNISLPPKNNKVTPKDETIDVAWRQGRNGRGSIQSKACLSVAKEKVETVDITKPFKSGRPNSDKSGSRIGRPSKKNAPDRKAHVRPAPIVNGGCSELTCKADDDREDLLEAAKAARTASFDACSSTFWKTMEQYFDLISSEDVDHVKDQISFAEELEGSPYNMVDGDRNLLFNSQIGLPCQAVSFFQKCDGSLCTIAEPGAVKTVSDKLEAESWFENIIPLSQRLLSAFIEEDGSKMFNCGIEQGDTVASNITSPNIHNLLCGYQLSEENGVPMNTQTMEISEFGQTNADQPRLMGTSYSGASPDECQFENMSLDDRILLELHSIDLYPETVPDLADGEDEQIDKAILELQTRLYLQVREKKNQLYILEKAIQGGLEVEDRKREQLALDKLTERAFKNLMGGRGSHGSSHKRGVSKLSKQLAMDFAKRTLARCKKFEETGRSSFSEPVFRDVLFSQPAKSLHAISPGTPATIKVDQLGSLVSASDAAASVVVSTIQRGKKREVLLDGIVPNTTLRATSTLSHGLPGGAKRKMIDIDREQHNERAENSSAKIGHPTLDNGRSGQKPKPKLKAKAKAKQKATNVLLPKIPEPRESANNHRNRVNQEAKLPSSSNLTQDLSKGEDGIFTTLPLHNGIDVADELCGQGQDLGSWLNVDEEALLEQDLMGALEIPMDNLAELDFHF